MENKTLKRIEYDLLEIKSWCEEKFKNEPQYKRRLPRTNIQGINSAKTVEEETEEQREIRLGRKLKYIGKVLCDLNNRGALIEGQGLYSLYIEILKEYKISFQKAKLLEAKEWCEEKFKNEPKYKRRLPRAYITGVNLAEKREEETEDQKEMRIGLALDSSIRRSTIYEKVANKQILSPEEQEIYSLYLEIYNNYNINLQEVNLLQIKEWCEEEFKDSPRHERRLPRPKIKGVKIAKKGEEETREQIELRLGNMLHNFKSSKIYIKVEQGEELLEEEERIYNLYKELDNNYNINAYETSLLMAKEWCEEKFKNKPRYIRRLPRSSIKGVKVAKKGEEETEEQIELRLGSAVHQFTYTKLYQKAQSGEKLTEYEQKIYNLYIELDDEYNISTDEANLLMAKEWCEENFKDRPIYERRLPRASIKGVKAAKNGEMPTNDQREIRIGFGLVNFRRRSDIYKKVQNKEVLTLKEQRIYNLYVELCNQYDINPQEANLLKVKEWCEEKFENKPRHERRLPRTVIQGVKAAKKGEEETEEQRELRLGRIIGTFRERSQIYEKVQNKISLTPEEQKIYDLYVSLETKYGRGRNISINWNEVGIGLERMKTNINAQDIGKASFDADTQKCDEMLSVVESLVNEKKKQKEGEQK